MCEKGTFSSHILVTDILIYKHSTVGLVLVTSHLSLLVVINNHITIESTLALILLRTSLHMSWDWSILPLTKYFDVPHLCHCVLCKLLCCLAERSQERSGIRSTSHWMDASCHWGAISRWCLWRGSEGWYLLMQVSIFSIVILTCVYRSCLNNVWNNDGVKE